MTLDELEAAARAMQRDRPMFDKTWVKYHLAASPETILDLIARLRAAEAVVDAVRLEAATVTLLTLERLAAYDALGTRAEGD